MTLGIRPRAFVPQSAPSADTVTGLAELIEPMGAETLVHARTQGGHEIRFVVPREIKVRVGETLHLKANARQTHVFDADGRAVRQ